MSDTVVVLMFCGQHRMGNRKVAIDLVHEKELVEVVNNYLSIPVTSFNARRIEQVQGYKIPR